jgi:hypothetical protein
MFILGAAYLATLFTAVLAMKTSLTGMLALPGVAPVGLVNFAAESRNRDPRHLTIPEEKLWLPNKMRMAARMSNSKFPVSVQRW